MFTIHYYNRNGEQLLDISNILPEDVQYFRNNGIKVSMEELNGMIIAYGCPYSDETEESEVIVFADTKTCEETMSELAERCKEEFGVRNV
jgi:hypothetical protein